MTETVARPMEVELKYRMTDVATGERLIGADELAGLGALGPIATVYNEDHYLDTPDAALAAAGYAGRLRSTEAGTVITLKGLRRQDNGGAAHRREELEGPADPELPPTSWPESAARDAVLEIVGDRPLGELAVLRQVRRKRLYGIEGSVVEVSVDDVEVVAGERVIERFAELEAELRDGSEAVLEPLAELLSEIEELVPAETSKLERAMDAVRREQAADVESDAAKAAEADAVPTDPAAAAARESEAGPGVTGEPVRVAEPAEDVEDGSGPARTDTPVAPRAKSPEPAKPEPRLTAPKTPGITADDHLAEAGRKVLRFHLARMLAREEGTRIGKDAEELHGMRVATRRQRAAWRVFGSAFDQERTRRHQQRLKLVARDLGGVRDLDVLIEAAEAYQKGQPGPEGAAFEPLIESWRVQRDAARFVLLRELDSGRYRKWVDSYIEFVQAEGQGVLAVGPVQPHRVRDSMPSRIWAAYENVRAYESVMRWADVNTLHDLRIAAKWLRYTLEFVREALGREAGPVIEKVVALQDHLGWLHDADVAAGLARAYLVEHAGDLTEHESAAIGRYLVDRERELARLRRTVGPAWRGVSSVAFRRALGRLVAGL